MKKFLSLSFISVLLTSCFGQTSKEVQTIAPEVFAQKLKATKNPQLLDVRTPEEFKSGHLANAVNIDWCEDDFAKKAVKYDKSKPIFVYCKAGLRGKKAGTKLAELGFTNIYNLEGGIDKWNDSSQGRTEQSQSKSKK